MVAHCDGTARLWDGPTGDQAYAYSGHEHWVASVAYAGDGASLLTGSLDRSVALGDTAGGARLPTFPGLDEPVTSVAMSPDGARVLAGGWHGAVKPRDAKTGAIRASFSGREEPSDSTAFSPDGRFLLTGGGDSTAIVWDVATGAELRTFIGSGDTVDAVGFSPDGRFALAASSHQTAKVWDVSTGAQLRTLMGRTGFIHSISVSRDGRFVLTASGDGTTRLWSLASGALLCSLLSFDDGTWAVIDPEGRFDAANAGDVQGVHCATSTEPIALFQLKERYHVPALLARILGLERKPLEQVTKLNEVALFPEVRAGVLAPGATRLTIDVTNQGGRIGRVRLLVNRKELVADARTSKSDSIAGTAKLVVDLAPALYAIIGGISSMRRRRSACASPQTTRVKMATAIEVRAKRLFGAGRVHLTLLATANDPTAMDPTKDNFRLSCEEAGKARPGDLLFVYLAGHGSAVEGEEKLCAYFTREMAGFSLNDPEVRRRRAITSEEFTEWIKHGPALKQVMVLDTCAAGLAGVRLVEQCAVSGDQVRALERLKDGTGFHILMGSAADAVSYETSRYAQALLTVALLRGRKGAALRDDEFVDVGMLFRYAADQIPRLALNLGGIQRPEINAPVGSSFDIGQFDRAEREQIPITSPKLVLRPLLYNPDGGDDDLQLSFTLKKHLCAVSAERSTSVFVDGDEYPSPVRVSGAYRVQGECVSGTITLARIEGEVSTQ